MVARPATANHRSPRLRPAHQQAALHSLTCSFVHSIIIVDREPLWRDALPLPFVGSFSHSCQAIGQLSSYPETYPLSEAEQRSAEYLSSLRSNLKR
jgi:hypothetical protein